MTNLFFGIPALLVSSFLFYKAYRNYQSSNFYASLAFILLAGLLLRVYAGTDFYLHDWDEKYHALVAKNLMQHPFQPTLYDKPVLPFDYKNWTANHVWLHKQPLPLWAMALSLKLLGINEIALRIPSIVLSTIGIWLTFQIAFYFFGNKVAALAAFFHAIHGLTIELTAGRVATDHVDIFFTFFIELGVFFVIKSCDKPAKKYFPVLIGICMGLAILSKWLPALIICPIWLLLISGTKKVPEFISDSILILVACAVIALPWQIYIFQEFPLEASWESGYNFRHLFEDVEGHGQPFFYHFDKLRIIYGELIYIPLIWLLYYSLKRAKKRQLKWLALSIWIFVPFLFFSFAKTKMQAYTLFSAPALFIISAAFIRYLRIIHLKNPKFIYFSNLLLFLLIALPVRYSFERIKPFSLRERNPDWAKELRILNKNIPGSNGILFNADRPIETMFYTELTAYPFLPNEAQTKQLKAKGFVLYFKEKETGKIMKLE